MKLQQFIEVVDNLDPQMGETRRIALEAIYHEVREQAVHDLAEAVRQRDRIKEHHEKAKASLRDMR
jgi:hypothetical protein